MTQTSQPHKDTGTELFTGMNRKCKALRQEGPWGSGEPRRMAGGRTGEDISRERAPHQPCVQEEQSGSPERGMMGSGGL